MLPALAAVLALQQPILVVDPKTLTPAQQVLVQSLQGLVDRTAPLIWFQTGGIQAEILQDLQQDRQTVPVDDVWTLVGRFRSKIKGAILCKIGTHSLNVADSLCGPMDAVAIDESLKDDAQKHGLDILLDATNLTEQQAFDKYAKLFRKGIVVEQAVDKPANLRDFAIKHDAFVMEADDRDFRKKVVAAMGPGALVFGWGRDEFQWISDISEAGGSGVAADWCTNLSALETIPAKIEAPVAKLALNDDHVRYVAFVLTDGDNIQWVTGGFATDPKYYGSPLRGKFPMTWEMSPLLAKFAPSVLEKIYSMATPSDDFVTGPGLPGYMFPHPSPDRDLLARESAPYLKESGLRTISILNQNEGSLAEVDPWLNLPEVRAAIYKDYAPYDRRHGELVWRHGKPCMAYRFILWEGLTGIGDLAAKIAAMPTSPKTDSASYALINVHAWSFNSIGGPIQAVQQVIQKLPPNTRVVTANQLLDVLIANHPAK
ncbi:MAG TPA: GxGYxYP domain-containing protein [Fimbriimonadaceae bacterium]|nr:GxGYxYP domain-containing protein [Fimbriimonadaceae bacterium]